MEEEIVELFSAEDDRTTGASHVDPWDVVYNEIRILSDRAEMDEGYTTSTAEMPENWRLNRWRDVKPYDHSRVVIKGNPETDYINANLVKVSKANRSYILTQGPLQSTVGHFWSMIWQNNSRAILMLNRIYEKGMKKCHEYWPEVVGSSLDCEEMLEVGLALENVSTQPGKHFTVRTLRLTNTNSKESREIYHFHYTTWPDFGVPKCPDSFLEFLKAVRSSGSLEDSVGPAIVHCSAGVGRSGTFCLVDSCLVLLEKDGAESTKIRDLLLEMRKYRMRLIQTKEQLKFSYVAIVVGGTKDNLWSTKASSSNGDQEEEDEHSSTHPSQSDKLSEICQRLSAPPQRNGSHSESDDSSSDDDSLGPAPPPPPRRTESLNHQADQVAALLAEIDSMRRLQEQQQALAATTAPSNGLPLPSSAEPRDGGVNVSGSPGHHSNTSEDSTSLSTLSSAEVPLGPNSASAPPKYILNDHKLQERKSEVELRRRNREEKRTVTESLVADMKRKAKETDEKLKKDADDKEAWRRFIRDKAVPFVVGLAMFLVGGYYFYAYPR